jgi:coenzyme F420-reducing hydrogenase beta subunit
MPNRWEEQFFLHADEAAEIEYGAAPEGAAALAERVREGRHGQHATARAARVSLRDVNRAAHDGGQVSIKLLGRLDRELAQMAATVDRQQPILL